MMFKDDELHETRYCENCLELQQKLQAKEQECEELKSENFTFEELIKTQEELIDKYKQALEEIEKYFGNKDTSKTSLFNIFVIEQEILNIINKAKRK